MSSSASCSMDVDLTGLILEAVRQVPAGRVTTYGDVARALGDIRAAKAVAEVLSHAGPDQVPRHRVVNQHGEVGLDDQGALSFIGMLKEEGITVIDGRVEGLDTRRFIDFQVPSVLSALRQEQEALRSNVIEEDDFPSSSCVAGFDVSYANEKACAALVRMDIESMEVVEVRCAAGRVRFPYIPGYLSYRELPMVRKVRPEKDKEILLVDGQGVLHPRGFGIASHIGVCLDMATIGAAKSLLMGAVDGEGERVDIIVDGRVRGVRLHPRGMRAIYVSVGHRVSLDTACSVCERLMVRGVPEPLRLAHILATRERKAMELRE